MAYAQNGRGVPATVVTNTAHQSFIVPNYHHAVYPIQVSLVDIHRHHFVELFAKAFKRIQLDLLAQDQQFVIDIEHNIVGYFMVAGNK